MGTGPRLQLLGLARQDDARAVERAFADWALAVDLGERLRVMRTAQIEDGEVFALLTRNPGLDSPVQLDLRAIEADQVATPDPVRLAPNAIDGIVFDAWGNPVEYHVLRRHPGDSGGLNRDFDRIPAVDVLHLFRPDRPGQRRGIPELTPAIPLFAQLRRYTLAVLAAAETAADFAGILYTDAPAGGEADPVEPMDTVELQKRVLTTMPCGWKLGQVHAEQPTTTFPDFVHQILAEILRCLLMPYTIGVGDSSSSNFSSAKLDTHVWIKAITVDQARLRSRVLDPLFKAWIREAILIEGFLPQRLRTTGVDWSHQWFWDGFEHIDPLKEANAQAIRLANQTSTLADEYARRGQDWEAQVRQRAREKALLTELGLTSAEAQPATQPEEEPVDA